jgi:hypothetical protein
LKLRPWSPNKSVLAGAFEIALSLMPHINATWRITAKCEASLLLATLGDALNRHFFDAVS